MQPPHALIQHRQMLQAHLPVSAAFAAKLVVRRAVCIQADHGQGRWGIACYQEPAVHAFLVQYPTQPGAKVVAG